MNAIILKYIQLLCVAALFDSVKCDQFMMEQSPDEHLLERTIGCTATCIRDNPTYVLETCYQQCTEKPIALLKPMAETESNETIRLVCRDADAIAIEVRSNMIRDSNEANFINELYVVRILETNNRFASKVVYITNSTYVKMENLAPNTSYIVSVSIFNAMLEHRNLPERKLVRTLPSKTYVPKIIPQESIQLSQFTFDENPKLLSVYVKWTPADDMVCQYGLILYETIENPDNKHPFQAFKIVESQQLYRWQATNLALGSHYHLAIRGINSKDETIEGPASAITFATPSCWDMHDFNTSLCPPQPLQNLTSTHTLVAKGVYNINVTWDQISIEQQPIYYTVSILPHYSESHSTDDAKQSYDVVSRNVTGDKNYAYFHNIVLNSVNYDIQAIAHAKGGTTVTNAQQSLREIYKSFLDRYQQSVKNVKILLPMLFFLLILLISLVVLYRRMKHKRSIEEQSEEIYLRELLSTFHMDNMEVKRSQITLYETLGEGAFGIVRKGKLMPHSMDVAVKMVKADSAGEEGIRASVKELLREIQLMKSVCPHQNIVGIVGHYTTDPDYAQMMLLTEYCSEGNLLNYLRASRRQSLDDSAHSLDKTPENIFHFDTSFAEKRSPKYNNLAEQRDLTDGLMLSNDSTLKYPEKNIQNLIVNKLYNELSAESHNRKMFGLSKPFTCNNSCKCRVEIIPHEDADAEPKTKCTIKIEDCDCQPYDVAATEPTRMLFAENRGYGVAMPANTVTKMDDERTDEMKNYENEIDTIPANTRILTSIDLLKFARQIASGMEFLANNKIVHRDLAARNVLVCADRTVKIADFGLSRDIYEDNIYKKSSAGRLPIKWLALESMLYQQYTTQSDVWSYGILLYEIVTLGCTPYPTVPANCLVHYLKSGNRMSRPSNCSQEFYELMTACWHSVCDERPSFSEISQKLDYFTQKMPSNVLIDIDAAEKRRRMVESDTSQSMESNSNTSYLKPI